MNFRILPAGFTARPVSIKSSNNIGFGSSRGPINTAFDSLDTETAEDIKEKIRMMPLEMKIIWEQMEACTENLENSKAAAQMLADEAKQKANETIAVCTNAQDGKPEITIMRDKNNPKKSYKEYKAKNQDGAMVLRRCTFYGEHPVCIQEFEQDGKEDKIYLNAVGKVYKYEKGYTFISKDAYEIDETVEIFEHTGGVAKYAKNIAATSGVYYNAGEILLQSPAGAGNLRMYAQNYIQTFGAQDKTTASDMIKLDDKYNKTATYISEYIEQPNLIVHSHCEKEITYDYARKNPFCYYEDKTVFPSGRSVWAYRCIYRGGKWYSERGCH